MNATLEHKTIRPGSLMSYSYYHSARRPGAGAVRAMPQLPKTPLPSVNRVWRRRLIVTVVVLAALIVLPIIRGSTLPVLSDSTTSNPPTITPSPGAAALSAPVAAGAKSCTGNRLDQFVLVSISQRHLWACQKTKQVFDSPVITGMQAHESTVTPLGTYRIYAKQTDTTLTGSDETGSWSDPVKYWLPFLNNKYGSYGFHDATWRPNDAFGKIGPDSSNASHGCVELPLAASAWLYSWSRVGTTVTIEN